MKNNRQMIVAATIVLSGVGLGAIAAPQAAATYPNVHVGHSAPAVSTKDAQVATASRSNGHPGHRTAHEIAVQHTDSSKKSDESDKKSKNSRKSEGSGKSTKSGKTEKSDSSPTTTKRKSSDNDEKDE